MSAPERGSEAALFRNDAGLLAAEVRFRVRFFETDAMRVVHHAAYLTWFEEGRSAFTRALGYPYSRMEAEGVSLAVAEANARYHRSARYDDEVVVRVVLAEFPSRGMTFTYEVRRVEDGELLVTGSTKHISVDREGRVVRFPDAVRAAMMEAAAAVQP